MTAEIDKKNLVITIPLQPATPSASGKSLIVATTNGFKTTDLTIDGKKLSIAVNAIVKV